MRHALMIHPASPCLAATRIDVEVAGPHAGHLVLCYAVYGRIADIRLPPVTAPTRRDELWRHTCFEAFARVAPAAAYYEFNFSPSTAWAAYRFDGYRSGMTPAAVAAPTIDVRSNPDCYTLRAALALDRLPDWSRDVAWRLGLSAVIEDTGGRLSYWALAHPAGKPDFHHADGFVHELCPVQS
jgi:hypothetical protein